MLNPALYAPLSDYYWDHDIRIEGQPESGPKDDVSSGWTRVTPRFFETRGDRIVMGRTITDASQLFGVRPWDPLMLSGATLLLGLAALIAAAILARRAASVDPMQSLRVECGRRSQIIGWRSAFFAARVRRLPLKVYVQLVDFQF